MGAYSTQGLGSLTAPETVASISGAQTALNVGP